MKQKLRDSKRSKMVFRIDGIKVKRSNENEKGSIKDIKESGRRTRSRGWMKC